MVSLIDRLYVGAIRAIGILWQINTSIRSADVAISSREDERLTKMPILMFLSGLHVHISHHTWLRIL